MLTRIGKSLLIVAINIFLVLGISISAFAAQDGPLYKTTQSASMYSGPGTQYSTVMTMASGEAAAALGSQNDYIYLKGWKYTTNSIVNGYVSIPAVTTVSFAYAKYALNTYYSESDSSYNGSQYDIPQNALLNHNYSPPRRAGYLTYSNLYYLGVQYYYYNGYDYTAPGGFTYVHTNFRTNSPSNYYLTI